MIKRECEDCCWFKMTQVENNMFHYFCHYYPPTNDGFPRIKSTDTCSKWIKEIDYYKEGDK